MPKSRRATTRRSASVATQGTVEFHPDYSDVKRDLKRIGTLAGTFFMILIVLSFFLR